MKLHNLNYEISRGEMVIDAQSINGLWLDILEKWISIYHPNNDKRDKNWGAGIHILKEYPRGAKILKKPKKLIKDIKSTVLKFYTFSKEFVN